MSPPSFDLLTEPWIPVEPLSGQHKEVSLRGLFEEAEDLRYIVHPSPVVTAALYRLALAVLHRAVPVADGEEWEDVWVAGEYVGAVTHYLDRHRDRFDLYHAEQPFLQVTAMPENCRPFPWTKLALELPPNSTKLLFDHTLATEPPSATPAEAARVLVASQSFAVGAGRSCIGYTYHAPLVAALTVIPEGRNLAETLLANLMPGSHEDDRPVWELPPLTGEDIENQRGESWKGPASRLSWLSRAVHLLPESTGDVKWIQFGMGFRPIVSDGDRDPWVSYRIVKSGDRVPRKLDPERMVWRDFHSMLSRSSDGSGEAVQALTRLALLASTDRQPPRAWTVLVAGVYADRANVKAWRQERWSVPEKVLREGSRLNALGRAMSSAEEAGEGVRNATYRVAFELLGGQGTADRNEAGSMAAKLPAGSVYWAALEAHFQRFLQLLGEDVDRAWVAWLEIMAEAVQDAGRATHAAIGRDARALKAWAIGGQRFGALAARLRREAADQGPGEEREEVAI